jgi:hypothetical protein
VQVWSVLLRLQIATRTWRPGCNSRAIDVKCLECCGVRGQAIAAFDQRGGGVDDARTGTAGVDDDVNRARCRQEVPESGQGTGRVIVEDNIAAPANCEITRMST